MERRAAKIDGVSVEWHTNTSRDQMNSIIDRAEKMKSDPDKTQRLADRKCKLCYYSGGHMAGAAITTRPCGICGEPQTYGSTATGVVCHRCAEDNWLCRQCSGDVDFKLRRNRKDI